MADSVAFHLKNLIRVCINDPKLKAAVFDALNAGPLPVRTPFLTVKASDTSWNALLRCDRNKSPGEDGFIPCDLLEWITLRLDEVAVAGAEASTMSADVVRSQLGLDKLEPPK